MDSGTTVNDTWSEYAYIFKIEVSGLVDRLDVSYKKKIQNHLCPQPLEDWNYHS